MCVCVLILPPVAGTHEAHHHGSLLTQINGFLGKSKGLQLEKGDLKPCSINKSPLIVHWIQTNALFIVQNSRVFYSCSPNTIFRKKEQVQSSIHTGMTYFFVLPRAEEESYHFPGFLIMCRQMVRFSSSLDKAMEMAIFPNYCV